MEVQLTNREFRLLLDMVYIGNWVLNATRGPDRFQEYDNLESKLFGLCRGNAFHSLVESWQGTDIPSRAYTEGGIHEAIGYYEDNIFYDILAEELSRRDMGYPDINPENYADLTDRMERYLDEFEAGGVDHLFLEE